MVRCFAAVLAVLAVSGVKGAAQSLDFTAGRMHFTLSSAHNVKLTADGVPIIRESHIYLVSPGWTSTLLNADNVTPRTSFSVSNGVYNGTAIYENTDAIITYTYQLGPDETYKVTVNYVSKGKAAEVEWDMAYLNANIIAGRAWSSVGSRGTKSGTVPIFATSADQAKSQLGPLLKSIHFDSALGPLDVTIQGSDSSVAYFRLFDARAGTQDWAQRNPMFWFGVGVSPIPSAGQTITATWHLGAAPNRTIINNLTNPPSPRDLPTVKIPYSQDYPVIPHPKETTDPGAPCRLGKTAYIAIPAIPSAQETQAAAELKSELATYWGVTATIGSSPPASVPVIALGVSTDPLVPQFAEGYRLTTTTTGVTVGGFDPRGVYNGAQTVKQLLRADTNGVYVRSAVIRDWPSLSMRGVHWFGGPDGLAFHKKMIDLIVAPYKMNTMLYECEYGKWASHPEIWSTTRGMTKSDMQQSVNYARTHFIEPIPLINSLGHADWMFENGQHLDLATDTTARYQYNPENPAVYTLLFDVMLEATNLFQPRYFHIGHDEVTTGGVFPKPGSTKTATELILADTVKINDWVKSHGMQTMMWGDEYLYYPTEASDAGNAGDLATAAARRAGLPKDIVITDWHYASTTSYPSVPVWKNGGWQVVGVPWYDTTNIQNLTSTVKANTGLGTIQSTWAGWSMYPDIVNTSAYNQFMAYLVAAEMSWSGSNPLISALGYNPDDAFRKAWNRTAIDLKSYKGAVLDAGSSNANMWDWIPGTHAAGVFPSGDQVWGGITFSLGKPVWLAGGINPAGTWPKTISIPMNGRPATELDFLWGTSWIGESGSPVVRFNITYTDGIFYEVRCVYGTQIQAFNDLRGGLATTTVWTGTDAVGQNVALRRWPWKNPRPDNPITTITLTSEISEAAPVFVGLTAVGSAKYTMDDVVRTLTVAGGLQYSGGGDMTRLNLTLDTPIGISDAIRVARRVAGLDTNP